MSTTRSTLKIINFIVERLFHYMNAIHHSHTDTAPHTDAQMQIIVINLLCMVWRHIHWMEYEKTRLLFSSGRRRVRIHTTCNERKTKRNEKMQINSLGHGPVRRNFFFAFFFLSYFFVFDFANNERLYPTNCDFFFFAVISTTVFVSSLSKENNSVGFGMFGWRKERQQTHNLNTQ